MEILNMIKVLRDINKNNLYEVGGKGASLGEMTRAGIPVPPGFVITADVYREFTGQQIPEDVQEEILQAFDRLGAGKVAVRSSALAEDSKNASWAGQLESYLNTKREELIENIQKCWESLKSERALSYAGEQNVPEDQMAVAVVVQKMVDSRVSGVMFTANPVTKNQGEMMIEAVLGLGEKLVSGEVTPDNFVVEKMSGKVVSSDIQNEGILADDQLGSLVQLGKEIEKHFGSPQDIEWAIDGEGKFWILQSRPITTL